VNMVGMKSAAQIIADSIARLDKPGRRTEWSVLSDLPEALL